MKPISRVCFTVLLAAALSPPARAADNLGLRVPPGFKVTLYADHELANDIYAMTLDAQGDVVVTSQGWVKRLLDTKGAGQADKAEVIAPTATGGMGLCFDGGDLYFCGDGWLSVYRAGKDKGTLEQKPERLFPLAFSEHGGHAMRKGPDGWWYVIAGNDAGVDKRHVTTPASPVQRPEAGALLRVSPDGKQCEVVAQGFRNPYRFDFNAAGDIFTYDSDVEADYFLPWYSPTRLYHVAEGGHHGWRLTGYLRSWCRPDYYCDTVDILYPIGRGSPTGVVCYRHDQFPERYRGGVFACDWTFGKVYYCPLTPDGTTYKTKPEVFLESVGANGFDPTDAAVAPDGSLFICMGGRKTRGAVYHVEYVGDGKTPVQRRPAPKTDLDKVLQAPQPLDAWSRAVWEPLARKLGKEAFIDAVTEHERTDEERTRAIEILIELFGGAPAMLSDVRDKPSVAARLAWSLGRSKKDDDRTALLLMALAATDARVQQASLNAIASRHDILSLKKSADLVASRLAAEDKRVQQAAARVAALLPDEEWDRLRGEAHTEPERLTWALASLWRNPGDADHAAAEAALSVLRTTRDKEQVVPAVRLLMLTLGDFRLREPPAEVYTAYSLQGSLDGRDTFRKDVRSAARTWFPCKDAQINAETSRLLAMLEDDDPAVLKDAAGMWTKESSPTDDMHYLIVYSRLRAERPPEAAKQVARAVLGLDRKLEGKQQRNKQNWNARLVEVLINLLSKDPRLADVLMADEEFVKPAHAPLAACLDADRRRKAAKLFLAAVQKDDDFAWSGPLIDLLAELPADDVRPVFRARWSDFALRDALVLQLTDKPDPQDREKFLTGLESGQPQVVRACLKALADLPRDEEPRRLAPLVRLLRQLTQEPREKELRAAAVALLARQAGRTFEVKEEGTEPTALKKAYEPVFAWFEKEHPKLAAAMQGGGDEDPAEWAKLLQSVDWDKGDAGRGEVLFRGRGCAACHTGTSRLGPDLIGVTSRFSRADLFDAIIYPSRDVAPPYRVVRIETRDGPVYSGIVAFESADGVILQTGAATTVRVATADIASRQPTTRSLMPDGLLKGLKPDDVADLYSHLQTLKPPR
jgi:putative membrane-bound dehydrogenase-like protein